MGQPHSLQHSGLQLQVLLGRDSRTCPQHQMSTSGRRPLHPQTPLNLWDSLPQDTVMAAGLEKARQLDQSSSKPPSSCVRGVESPAPIKPPAKEDSATKDQGEHKKTRTPPFPETLPFGGEGNPSV